MKLMHLPVQRLGTGDIIVVPTGANSLPVSFEIWNSTTDNNGRITFYVRESNTFQLTFAVDDIVACFR